MKKIVIFTSDEVRHKYFRYYLSNQKKINVLKTFSVKGKSLREFLILKNKLTGNKIKHLKLRHQTENLYFREYIKKKIDKSNNSFCKKSFLSSKKCLNKIKNLNPDLIIVYGSSIIKGAILKEYKKKIINIHLGLSPYYTGSGTNFFPFVNNEPQFAGATFMFLDEGIDTGEIIHQIRARILKNDNIHKIGNRLIKDDCKNYSQIIINFNKIKKIKTKIIKKKHLYYRKRDFTNKSLEQMNYNFKTGMIKKYLNRKQIIDKKFPLIRQKWIKIDYNQI